MNRCNILQIQIWFGIKSADIDSLDILPTFFAQVNPAGLITFGIKIVEGLMVGVVAERTF
jgi:hypothetical protein